MRPIFVVLFSVLVAAVAQGQPADPPQAALAISIEALGDSEGKIATRIVFTIDTSLGLPSDREVVLQGTILHGAAVVRNFRRTVGPADLPRIQMIQSVPPGEITVEARLMAMGETSPMLLTRAEQTVTLARTGLDFVAAEDAEADAILAEGLIPVGAGSVRIQPPRRDLAPNLFTVDVDVKAPVRRVEFWVEGKKVLTRNGPPYRAELDLGAIPQRVELRAVGYDSRGRYIDADAWIVNERENALEVKVTRTETPDGISHFKVSVQNPTKIGIHSLELFANDELLVAWGAPPYAIDVPTATLAGKDFVRATLIDVNGTETTDLVYLDGDRYFERVDVNLVELSVTVSDLSGAAIAGLKKEDFRVLEDGNLQTVETFGFSSDLPLSIGVLVDHSGSMKPRIEQARRAALEFFAQVLRENDRAFFGGFAFSTKGITPFVTSVATLQSEIGDLPPAEGATALYDAIISGLYRFRAVEGRKALIIVSDGEDTASRVAYEDMLQYVRAARVPLYFIGVGLSRLDFSLHSKLRSLADETGGVAYFIGKETELSAVYGQLENELRSQYLVGYYTQTTKNDRKYRTVDVRVDREGAKVKTIRGFIP